MRARAMLPPRGEARTDASTKPSATTPCIHPRSAARPAFASAARRTSGTHPSRANGQKSFGGAVDTMSAAPPKTSPRCRAIGWRSAAASIIRFRAASSHMREHSASPRLTQRIIDGIGLAGIRGRAKVDFPPPAFPNTATRFMACHNTTPQTARPLRVKLRQTDMYSSCPGSPR